MTASSSVEVLPSAFSTAPGWGPCGSPDGCRVMKPWSNYVHGQVLNVTGGLFTGMTT